MNRAERDAKLAVLKRAVGGNEALFRPSSAPRWTKCKGSVWMSAKAPRVARTSSKYADEGTAAHAVVAEALEGKRQSEEWVDRAIKAFPDRPDMSWHVDEEMAECANLYLDVIESRKTPNTQVFVEHKLSLSALDPSDPLLTENTGTGDAVLVDLVARKATIVDLKYGKGVAVSGETAQIKDYGLMTLATFGPMADKVGGWLEIETIIVQPRMAQESQRIKAVTYDPFTLAMEFAGELVGSMEAALDENAPLVPGDYCRWCPGAAICPALRDSAVNIGRDAFAAVPLMTASTALAPIPAKMFVGGVQDPRPVTGSDTVALPSSTSLSVDEIATILSREDLYDAWIAAVKHRAVQLIEGGSGVPGWKMEQRSGNRRWKDPDKAPLDLLPLGLKKEDMFTAPKLKSPAQIEKVLPSTKKTLIADLVERPMGAPTLTRATTEKPALPPKMGAIPESQR